MCIPRLSFPLHGCLLWQAWRWHVSVVRQDIATQARLYIVTAALVSNAVLKPLRGIDADKLMTENKVVTHRLPLCW